MARLLAIKDAPAYRDEHDAMKNIFSEVSDEACVIVIKYNTSQNDDHRVLFAPQ